MIITNRDILLIAKQSVNVYRKSMKILGTVIVLCTVRVGIVNNRASQSPLAQCLRNLVDLNRVCA